MMEDLKKDFWGDVCSDGMETDEEEAAECFCDLQRQWIGSSGHAIYHGVRRATKRRMDGREAECTINIFDGWSSMDGGATHRRG